MILPPLRSTRTSMFFPYTTLFRSRDCRALLDEVARRARQFVEILLVERRGEASDGRSGRTRIVAVLLAEFGVDGAGAILEHLGEAADGFGGLVLALGRGIARLGRSLARQRRRFVLQRSGLLRRLALDRVARRGKLVADRMILRGLHGGPLSTGAPS